MHKTMDDLRATEDDNIIKGSRRCLCHVGCTVSRISDDKVVMFSPPVLRLSITTRRNAKRRGRVC
jgi:hypothetical protein